jgi:type IX secretion system PorP/SprF family membrane protein
MKNASLSIAYRYIFISAFLICNSFTTATAQQKAQFTQYMFNELILNPAVAGNEGALSITLLDRNQWVSVDGAPRTQTLSAHSFFESKNLGAGLSFVNDKIGIHKVQNLLGDLSYRLAFSNEKFLSMALRTGMAIRKSDYASISGSNSTDPALVNPDFTHTSLTLGAGLYYNSARLKIGISAPDLLPEKIYVSDTVSIRWRRAQYFLLVKYQWPLNSSIDIAPSVLIKYLYGLPVSYDINASVILKKVLSMGLSYRRKESISFLLNAKITPQLKIGYAYDSGIGKMAPSAGSHEAMLNYVFRYTQHNIVSPR